MNKRNVLVLIAVVISIIDIKPYLSSVPAEKLRRGWLGEAEARKKDP